MGGCWLEWIVQHSVPSLDLEDITFFVTKNNNVNKQLFLFFVCVIVLNYMDVYLIKYGIKKKELRKTT